MGREIAEDLAAGGSFVTSDDLRDYRPRVYQPLQGSYRGLRVTAVRPPDTGQSVLQLLRLVEPFDIGAMDHGSVEYLHIIGSALQLAHLDRLEFNADPEFNPVPVEEILSDDRLAGQVEQMRHNLPNPLSGSEIEQGHTTTVSVADEQGSMISLTHTLGWASGVVTPGLGFIYNNGMNLADPRPGRPEFHCTRQGPNEQHGANADLE